MPSVGVLLAGLHELPPGFWSTSYLCSWFLHARPGFLGTGPWMALTGPVREERVVRPSWGLSVYPHRASWNTGTQALRDLGTNKVPRANKG